jgi:cell division protein FtsX
MNATPTPEPRSPSARTFRPLTGVLGALIGGVVGLLVGAGVYLLVTPALETSDGLLRELQGLSWNLVPGLAVLGVVVGVLVMLRLSRRS